MRWAVQVPEHEVSDALPLHVPVPESPDRWPEPLALRVIGRRELSKLEPFDLILLIILGDAVQQGLTQDDYSLTGSMLAVEVAKLTPDELGALTRRDAEKWGKLIKELGVTPQ